MAVEISTSADQTVQAGGSILFDLTPVPCYRGIIQHRDGSAITRLASPALLGRGNARGCGCRQPTANYVVDFHGNVAVPTGGTVGTISLAIVLDGEADPSGTMAVTPAAVEQPANVGAGIVAEVPWICRCSTVAVRNTSDQAITVIAGANLVIDFDGVR